LGEAVVWWAEKVQEASGGEIVIELLEPGKVANALGILDAVSEGKVDAGVTAAGFYVDKIPAGPIFNAIPFGPEADEYLAWLFHGDGLKLDQEMYDQAGYNIKVLPYSVSVPEASGWFSKPIKSVDDLKGLRMRFFGYGAQVMRKLGVSAKLLPAGEIAQAMKNGDLDAAELSMPSIDKAFGLYKVAKYNYFPGWHQQATIGDLYINKDKWNRLSKSQQTLIEVTTLASMVWCIAHGEGIQGRVIRENVESRGVENMYWSEEMLIAFNSAWEEVVADLSAKDAFFRKAYGDLQAFREEYEYWQSLGFLPRNCR
jgi:TRAP-type mannitol/chloroaromatic compound transport system substrate-binding protein